MPEQEAAWDREEYLVAYMACSQTPKVNPSDGGHAKDTANNTFIGLRIINATADLAYYVGLEWRCFLDLSCCLANPKRATISVLGTDVGQPLPPRRRGCARRRRGADLAGVHQQ